MGYITEILISSNRIDQKNLFTMRNNNLQKAEVRRPLDLLATGFRIGRVVEPDGIEPTTSSLQS